MNRISEWCQIPQMWSFWCDHTYIQSSVDNLFENHIFRCNSWWASRAGTSENERSEQNEQLILVPGKILAFRILAGFIWFFFFLNSTKFKPPSFGLWWGSLYDFFFFSMTTAVQTCTTAVSSVICAPQTVQKHASIFKTFSNYTKLARQFFLLQNYISMS